jgi:rRNA processing protein Krr1/Pno1
MIRDLQARSGCRIDVDQNVPDGAPRIISYKGTRTTIDFAKQLVSVLCREGGSEADLPLGQAIKKLVLVPASVIGKVIGRGGEMIRELQSKSSAKIQVDHTAMGEMRHINVTGTTESVAKAEEMIHFLAANPAVDAHEAITMLIREKAATNTPWGSGPPYPNLPNQGQGMPASNDMGGGMYGGGAYGQPQQPAFGGYMQQPQQQASPYGQAFQVGPNGIASEVIPCEKMYMGRVIGQKGVTINDLQKRSGCDIQINQNVPMGQPCEISIKGTMQGIQTAKQMLQEIIELGPNHPYAGGRKYTLIVLTFRCLCNALTYLLLCYKTDNKEDMATKEAAINSNHIKAGIPTKDISPKPILHNSNMVCSNSTVSPCTSNSSNISHNHQCMVNLVCLCLRLKHLRGDQPPQRTDKFIITIKIQVKQLGISQLVCLKGSGEGNDSKDVVA